MASDYIGEPLGAGSRMALGSYGAMTRIIAGKKKKGPDVMVRALPNIESAANSYVVELRP